MKLTKINYKSAVFFGAITFVMYLALGVLQWSLRDVLVSQGVTITWVQTFIVAPIVGAIVGYLVVLVIIAVYNLIAKKCPISWKIGK